MNNLEKYLVPDWNTLMKAVEYVQDNTDYFITIYYNSCKIHCTYPSKMNDIEVDGFDTRESVYEALGLLNKHIKENGE